MEACPSEDCSMGIASRSRVWIWRIYLYCKRIPHQRHKSVMVPEQEWEKARRSVALLSTTTTAQKGGRDAKTLHNPLLSAGGLLSLSHLLLCWQQRERESQVNSGKRNQWRFYARCYRACLPDGKHPFLEIPLHASCSRGRERFWRYIHLARSLS